MKLYLSYNLEDAPEGFVRVSLDCLPNYSEPVEEILLVGVYERHKDPVALVQTIHKLLPVGGTAKFVCGYYGAAASYCSPFIIRVASEGSLNWCNKKWREDTKWGEAEIDFDFEVGVGLATDPALNLRNDETQTLWRTTRMNCVQAAHLVITKK